MAGKVTLRALARELGLHSSTVSRALNGHPAIDRKTVERVKKAALRMGYKPNPDVALAMRAIRRASEKSLHGIIGVLNFYPDTPDGRRQLEGLPQYVGVLRRAKSLGWVADTIPVRAQEMTWRRVRTILRARNIAGVILLPPPLGEVPVELDIEGLQAVATSVAWLGVRGTETVTTVLPAHWRNAIQIFEYLREAGYRRPMLHVHEGIEQRHLHATVAAFLYTQHARFWEAKIPVHERPLERKSMCRTLEKYRPDVIVGPDAFVKDFLERDIGLKIPGDCGFMMYSHSVPGIAGIDQRMDIVGETATELLTGMILHAEPSGHGVLRTMHVLGSITPGPTLPSKKAKP